MQKKIIYKKMVYFSFKNSLGILLDPKLLQKRKAPKIVSRIIIINVNISL